MRGLVVVLVITCAAGGGCGGARGPTPADAAPDARADDGPPPDLGPADVLPPTDGPPTDVVVPPDGPPCDPGGGHVTGSLCTIDLDCACPRTCLRLRDAPASGSCWLRCDPARTDPGTGLNPDCQATETCRAGADATGGCLPRGTLAGSFDVPMYQAPAQPASPGDLGPAAVTLEVGLVGQMTFASGWGTTANEGGVDLFRLYLFPGSGATVDWNKPLVIDLAADASYQPGATYDLAATPAGARVEYHEIARPPDFPRDVLRATVPGGTLQLTAAGTAARAPVTGVITGATAVEYEAELCGESTGPCP